MTALSLGSSAEDRRLVERQLHVLRTTYPAWDVRFRPDVPAGGRWTAVLGRPLTAQLAAGGVRKRLAAPDAITLASALAHHTTLLHARRRPAWPA
ncbi:hypothetical protein ACIBP6_46475 [Nonomuraea terrae]|uniref:hypothetical protein n=1 Tax=Nonomuraea terrae TaxID=2530383 RepID=UPI00379B2BCD